MAEATKTAPRPKPPAKAPAKAPISPPRALILLEAPTNGLVAGHFIKKGYSVEIVRDLKYCTTPLLKSARHIVIGPNEENSLFYTKIVGTLKKMVPDRLFLESGQDLLNALRKKVSKEVQPNSPVHPSDPKVAKEKRQGEEEKALQAVEPVEQVSIPEPSSKIEELAMKVEAKENGEALLEALTQNLQRFTPSGCSLKMNEPMRKSLSE
ncbi:MAG: hypothetical protein HQL32_06340, partial [Planctomycetes bacterium]|nr:hypothetical protein [Planctomycetota bacterium]